MPIDAALRFADVAGPGGSFCTQRWNVADARSIVCLAGLGLPVISENAAEMVRYLHQYEAANRETLQRNQVVSQCGWVGEHVGGLFLFGRTLIAADHAQPLIRFRGADEGDDQLVDAIATCGNFDTSRNVLAAFAPFPVVCFVAAAALASILLKPLRVPSFTIEFAGDSSTGKTTTMQITASQYGSPSESAENSYLRTWKSTDVARRT